MRSESEKDVSTPLRSAQHDRLWSLGALPQRVQAVRPVTLSAVEGSFRRSRMKWVGSHFKQYFILLAKQEDESRRAAGAECLTCGNSSNIIPYTEGAACLLSGVLHQKHFLLSPQVSAHLIRQLRCHLPLKGKAFVFDVRYIRSNKPGGSHSAGFILYFTSPLPFRARDFISRLPRALSAPGTISPAFVRAIFVSVGPISS